MIKKSVSATLAIAIFFIIGVSTAPALIIDDWGPNLSDLNDTTADGNPVTLSETLSTDIVVGGERYSEANSTVVDDEGFEEGICITSGKLLGDPGNYGCAGNITFVYGRNSDLNIDADQSSSDFTFDLVNFYGDDSVNLSVVLNAETIQSGLTTSTQL